MMPGKDHSRQRFTFHIGWRMAATLQRQKEEKRKKETRTDK